jgi:uncharacterized protein (DUF1684 family)
MRSASWLAVVMLLSNGCSEKPWPRPPSIPPEQFAREFNAWRDYRRSRLVAPGPGPVTWVGLWDLPQGAMQIGSDSTLPIVLPASQAPKYAGIIQRNGGIVQFEPARGGGIQLADETAVVSTIPMHSGRTDSVTTLAVGTLRLRVHGEPGTDRLWLRAWDEEHPAIKTFTMPDAYPPDTSWRVAARFEPFEQPRDYRVADIADGTQAYRSTGELAFRVKGKEQRLVVFAEPKDTMFFVMIWDSTARSTTYQGGRYMRVPLPDSTGWTVLDFNRAYSPPCVFTSFSTCAFPPAENRLQLAVEAGEQRVR